MVYSVFPTSETCHADARLPILWGVLIRCGYVPTVRGADTGSTESPMVSHEHVTEPDDTPSESPTEETDFVTEVLTYLVILDHDEDGA